MQPAAAATSAAAAAAASGGAASSSHAATSDTTRDRVLHVIPRVAAQLRPPVFAPLLTALAKQLFEQPSDATIVSFMSKVCLCGALAEGCVCV